MLTRQQRRAAERAALKQARRDASQPPPSEARTAANQANAQLSTGPRTEAGKAKSSQNSFKHGLYSKQLIIPGENPAELDALRSDLLAEHQPATETEAILVNEMADQYWRLCRCRRFETVLLADEFNLTHMNAVQRMMTSAERGFHKSLAALSKLQKARGFVPQKPVAGVDEAALRSEPKTQGEFVRKSTPQDGFVSQIPTTQPAEEDLNDPAILEKDRKIMEQLWGDPRFSKAPSAA